MIYLVTNQESIESPFERVPLERCIDYCLELDEVANDIETDGLDARSNNIISIQVGDEKDQFVVDCRTIHPTFMERLMHKPLILQNAKFDIGFYYKYKMVPDEIYDTFLAEVILTTGLIVPRKLDYLAQKYTNVTLNEEIKGNRGNLHKQGLTKQFIQYAAEDIIVLPEIKRKQLALIEEQNMSNALLLDNAFVKVLAYVEFSGIKLDVDKWKSKCAEDKRMESMLKEKLDQWVVKNMPESRYVDRQMNLFNTELGSTIKWSSPKQTVEFLEDLGLDVLIRDKANPGQLKRSSDAKVVKKQVDQFSGSTKEVLELYLEYKEKSTECSKYGYDFLKHINPNTGRVHTSYRQIINTGRMSSGDKKTKKPNLQNIKSKDGGRTKNCFVSEPGYDLIDCDYSAQEKVITANFSQDRNLIEFFLSGAADPHSFVASKMFPELATLSAKEIKALHNDKRQLAKTASFSIDYGGNADTIAENLSVSKKVGQTVYDAYFNAFPGLKAYYRKKQDFALTHGYVLINGATGRRSFIPEFEEYKELAKEVDNPYFWMDYREEKAKGSYKYESQLKRLVRRYFTLKGEIERVAVNYVIQGTSADCTKLAGVLFFNWLKENDLLFKVWLPNVVHDEWIAESPEELTETVKDNLVRCMVEAGDKFCKTVPLKASPEVGKFWNH